MPKSVFYLYILVGTTDIRGRSQNLRHFDPSMGLKLGVFGFSRNQNNRSSSGVYVTCIFCGHSEREDKHVLKCHKVCENWGHICFAFVFACVVSKNPNTPNLSPIADDTITRTGQYTRFGISLVYLWLGPTVHLLLRLLFYQLRNYIFCNVYVFPIRW